MGYSVERHIRFYDDDTGEFICVRPDPDCGDCVAIFDGDRHIVTLSIEQSRFVVDAIGEMILAMRGRQ